MGMHQVFRNQAANGKSGILRITHGWQDMRLVGAGSLGGGTVRVEVSPDTGGTWVARDNVAAQLATVPSTAAGIVIPNKSHVRLDLSGATSPNLSVWSNLLIPPPANLFTEKNYVGATGVEVSDGSLSMPGGVVANADMAAMKNSPQDDPIFPIVASDFLLQYASSSSFGDMRAVLVNASGDRTPLAVENVLISGSYAFSALPDTTQILFAAGPNGLTSGTFEQFELYYD